MNRLIVFDIGNVLLRFNTGIAARNFDRHDPGKGKAMAEALWSHPIMHRFETGKISSHEVFAKLKKKFGLRMSFMDWKRSFSDIFEPIAENVSLFRRFTRERRVALLSNVNELHWRHIHHRWPVLRRAHVPCGSHEMGVMKPHRRAYATVAERAGVPLRKMVYVDDREEFILAARRWGVTALHYTGKRPLKDLFLEEGIS